jgi:hypothetical protein
MAKTRITNEMRNELLNKVRSTAFTKEFAALDAEESRLALAAYRTFVSEELEARLRALPTDYITWVDSLGLDMKYGDSRNMRRLKFAGECRYPWLAMAHYHYEEFSSPTIFKSVAKMEKARQALIKERDKLVLDTNNLLIQARTVEKLAEVAPNLAKLLPPAPTKLALPMVIVTNTIDALLNAGVLEAAL